MTNPTHIVIDGKKRTVSSAKFKKSDPGILAVRTYVFGQCNDIGFDKEHCIILDDGLCLRANLRSHSNDERIEHLEFEILETRTTETQ